MSAELLPERTSLVACLNLIRQEINVDVEQLGRWFDGVRQHAHEKLADFGTKLQQATDAVSFSTASRIVMMSMISSAVPRLELRSTRSSCTGRGRRVCKPQRSGENIFVGKKFQKCLFHSMTHIISVLPVSQSQKFLLDSGVARLARAARKINLVRRGAVRSINTLPDRYLSVFIDLLHPAID